MNQVPVVIVRYGRKGSQAAIVLSASPDGLAMRVQKYLANSRRFTKTITVVRSEVIGEASARTAAETRRAWAYWNRTAR